MQLSSLVEQLVAKIAIIKKIIIRITIIIIKIISSKRLCSVKALIIIGKSESLIKKTLQLIAKQWSKKKKKKKIKYCYTLFNKKGRRRRLRKLK